MSAMRPAAAGRGGWMSTAIAASTFAVGGLAAATMAGLHSVGLEGLRYGQVTWLTLLLGVFLGSGLAWRAIVVRSWRVSALRGGAAGVLAAIVSYPATLLLAEFFRSAIVGAQGLGERLVRSLEVAALLLVTTGFAAACVMAVIGLCLGILLRRTDAAQPTEERGLGRVLAAIGATLVVLLAGAFGVLSAIPLDAGGLDRPPQAGVRAGYDEAIANFVLVAEEEAALDLDPRCKSTLLTHGTRTAMAVIYFHGLTTCPAQADQLAEQLFALGYNVYLPRFPLHGKADRNTDALQNLTAEDIVGTANRAVDIAGGLGDQVVAIGLSGGGAAAMWAAQNRADIDGTVAMAPFLSPYGLPQWANRAAMNLLLLMPNVMVMWDPDDPDGPPGMDYAYPQVASRAVGEFIRLGEIMIGSASRTAPLGGSPGVLVTEADTAVNNDLALQLAAAWERHGANVDIETIPLARGVIHDFIDPRQPEADVEYVYPIIFEMIARTVAGVEP